MVGSFPPARGIFSPVHSPAERPCGGEQAYLTAERAAARLPPLLLAAERVAATVAQGLHGRRRAGPGEAFWQFRPYAEGDSLRSIDWRQTAKSSRPHVRDREWTAAQTVYLWPDIAPGMQWRSSKSLPRKADRATLLILALGVLLGRGGERLRLLSRRPQGDSPPWFGQGAATRLAERLAQRAARPPATESPDRKTEGIPVLPSHPLPHGATAVVISDFLYPVEDILTALQGLAQREVHGHLVQVLDPAEETLPFHGRVLFTPQGDSTLAPWLVPRVEDIRPDYLARFQAHREAVRQTARRLGWSFTVHHTDESVQSVLLALHQHMRGTPAGTEPAGRAAP